MDDSTRLVDFPSADYVRHRAGEWLFTKHPDVVAEVNKALNEAADAGLFECTVSLDIYPELARCVIHALRSKGFTVQHRLTRQHGEIWYAITIHFSS